MRPHSNRNAIREDKIREDKIREDKRKEDKIRELFDRFWNEYDKKTSKEKCFKKFSALTSEEMEQLFIHVPQSPIAAPATPDNRQIGATLNHHCQ